MTRHREVAPSDRPRKVLYIVTKANWGGAQRYVYDLAVNAKEAGHDVLVVSGVPGVLTERLSESGIATEIISSMERDVKLKKELDSFHSLLSIVRRFSPDVLHANSSKAGGLGALVGRIARVPRIVFTSHGWAFNEDRPKWQKIIIGLFHYGTVLLAHRTICVSSALQMDAAWMPFVQKRFSVIHNGIDAVSLLPQSEARMRLAPDVLKEFPNAVWVGVIGELHKSKGLDTLIEAFAAIAQDHPQAVLVIMGDGEEWTHLAKLVQIYDLPKRIVLAGFVPDAVTHLSALDLFVLPSRTEALGYVLLEAGAAGLPAIGTRVGGIPEILEDGKTGVLVPKSDMHALAQALSTLISDAPLRARIGKALNEKVLNEFSVKKMVDATLAIYRS